MFPSFYKTWINPGPGAIEAVDTYVFGDKTGRGEKRLAAPLQLNGVGRDAFRSIGRYWESRGVFLNAVGSINFSDRPPDHRLTEIADDFFGFAYAGIDHHHRAFFTGRHLKTLKISDKLSADVHFGFLPVLLGNDRVFYPYFAEKDFYGFLLWSEKINYHFNFDSPYDPQRYRITAPRIFGSDTPEIVKFKHDLSIVTKEAWDGQRINSAMDVLELLMSFRGVTRAEHKGRSTVVAYESIAKPVLLSGRIFIPDFDADRLRKKLEKLRRLSAEQVELEYKRILKERADRHFTRFGTPIVRWTYSFLDLLNIPTNPPPYEYHTALARSWDPTLRIDSLVGEAVSRIGGTCQLIQQNLGRIGREPRKYLLPAEPIGGRRGGTEDPIAAIGDLAVGLERHHQFLRGTIEERKRTNQPGGTTADISGIIPKQVANFGESVARLGWAIASWPISVGEVECAVDHICSGKKIDDRTAGWFSSLEPPRLKPEILDWLKFADTYGGIGELKEKLYFVESNYDEISRLRESDIPIDPSKGRSFH